MPKEKRYQSKTKVYHVMSRALNKQMLFDSEHDFLVYLNILSQAKKEYDMKIYAYCLMTNHVHLLLSDLKNNISKFMNKINSINDNYKIFDKKEFLMFNETDNRDKCMDILCNKLNDEEATKILYDLLKINNKKEYLKLEEPIIVVNVIKLIDMGIPLMQLSRVTGLCYSKIQRLRLGKEGKVISLSYKARKLNVSEM